jgi:hypothetical protein
MRLGAWVSIVTIALLPACTSPRPDPSVALQPIKPEPYVRIYDADTNLVQLQIAVRKFVPARHKGPAVWLTGVSHIGESNYFVKLQEHLDAQRLVLFEGISDRAVQSFPAADGSEAHSDRTADSQPRSAKAKMASLQSTMASSLGLAFQLEVIDYDRANFRNSDLSLQELRQLLADRGGAQSLESLLQMMEGGSFLDTLLQMGLRFLGATPKLQALSKLALLEMIGQLQGDPAQVRGLPVELKQLLEVLIDKRNEKVIRDLKVELKNSRGSIAIFFGTGHMPDFERRLRGELDYRPVQEQWLTAFSIDLRATGISRGELESIRKFVESALDQPRTDP